MSDAKEVVNDYLEAFKKGDFKHLRSVLADHGKFGHAGLSADAFVESIKKGPAWHNVQLIKSVYSGNGAAILYEGTNANSGQRMQASEFLDVSGGKIESVRGAIVGAAAALPQTGAFSSFAVMAEAI